MSELLTNLLDNFARAPACWFGSVRPDGRVHLAPIWHVWHENAAYVVTQQSAVRAQNLRRNASVSLALPDPMNALMIEGWAEETPAAATTLRPLFQAKYDWDIANDASYNCIICITPTKLLAWGDHGEGRWRFDRDARQWSQLA